MRLTCIDLRLRGRVRALRLWTAAFPRAPFQPHFG